MNISHSPCLRTPISPQDLLPWSTPAKAARTRRAWGAAHGMAECRGEAIILASCLGVLGSVGTSGKEGEGSAPLQLAGNKGPLLSSSIVMDFK